MSAGFSRTVVLPRNPALHIARTAGLPNAPGVVVGPYVFISGMGPVDPVTGERSHGPIGDQVRITLENMRHMLHSAGSSMDRVVRVQVVLASIADVPAMDAVYRDFFPVAPPARMVWAMQLRFGNGVEIECLALKGQG